MLCLQKKAVTLEADIYISIKVLNLHTATQRTLELDGGLTPSAPIHVTYLLTATETSCFAPH